MAWHEFTCGEELTSCWACLTCSLLISAHSLLLSRVLLAAASRAGLWMRMFVLVLAAAAVAAKSLWYIVHEDGSRSSSVAGLGLGFVLLRVLGFVFVLLRAAATVTLPAALHCPGRFDKAAGVSEVPWRTFSLSICVLRCLAGPKETGTCLHFCSWVVNRSRSLCFSSLSSFIVYRWGLRHLYPGPAALSIAVPVFFERGPGAAERAVMYSIVCKYFCELGWRRS